ncbi:MAG: hypothetical protein HYR70_13440 [Chloroflexi bacterium]|nr:hypothetical protein [Chloroflexota bacterium]MBI3339635.1 hypothetical protein [Chloroflexota bacterium]
MTTNKQRLEKLQNQTKPEVKIIWRDFVEWANGKKLDTEKETRLEEAWQEFVNQAGGEYEQK